MFLILLVFCLPLRPALITNSCIEPPLECPNINITFWLYTKANDRQPFQILVNDSKSIETAPWVVNAPIKILIHGYTGYKDFSPNTEIRPAYMECCNYNIISVDYNPLAREPCYIEASHNTKLVGKCTAQLIDELVTKYHFPLKLFHVIGFSLGGQAAGFVGQNVRSGKLYRISGLDPALPLFVTKHLDEKLDKTDAIFVDVLHTNALGRGKLEDSGHVDFYANGGSIQPGCRSSRQKTLSSCSHARAPIYYAESITSKEGFYGTKCHSWIAYIIGWCELHHPDEEELFGEYVSREARGQYFFNTNAEPPYARGPNSRTSKKNH
ncbi:unnamed protein product [Arctia plantaginis]|uniref:Lipase domain-containing protein n=1 Tax=Arctia plantaginis TaxID=874455 RepID=A0A8S0YUH5_ARCPL|nr:unnamed protein product [Arctia plantaginis]CAB3247808.1 unnamed protein product [Arctia plantaginis]